MFRRCLPLVAFALGVSPVFAQTAPVSVQAEAPPPHLSVLEGRADIGRGTEREQAVANTPLVLGDQLAVADGRAEVLLGDGSMLHLADRTTVEFNGDTLVRLTAGRLILRAEGGVPLQIDTAPASIRVPAAAEVHVTLYDDGGAAMLQVGVARGLVEVDAGGVPVAVRAGQQVYVRDGQAPSELEPFNSARVDDFVRWSQALVEGRRGATSTQYLPAEVRVYGSTFDQYGSWSYAAPYGYVWYPRVVSTWRPYYHGRWRHAGHYGWTFIGYDPWGWTTHHYGRWGISSAGSWFWIPSRGWSAAWVNWAIAPGYVGWCPLGWNNRPVLGFWGHGSRSAFYAGSHHDPWRAWSVVSTRSFRGGSPIHNEQFDRRAFTGARAPTFVVQPTQPSIAVPRGSGSAPGYRIAGPSVAPRNGQSRRGEPPSTPGSMSRGPSAASAPALPRAVPPAVIYHRGTPIDPSSGASAYGRAGVAVPRGLPADAGSSVGPAGANRRSGDSSDVTRSPYGSTVSPYSRGRSSDVPQAGPARERGADHPDYAVPRGERYAPTPYRAPETSPRPAPQYRAPEGQRDRSPDAGGGSSQGSQSAPRATPRGDGGGSRAQGAPAGPRSSGNRGSSSGTAVRRR